MLYDLVMGILNTELTSQHAHSTNANPEKYEKYAGSFVEYDRLEPLLLQCISKCVRSNKRADREAASAEDDTKLLENLESHFIDNASSH